MTDVPIVLRAQSVYLCLIGHRVIVFAHFLRRGVASIELRACCFKPNELSRFRFEAISNAYFRVRSNFSASLE